MQIIPVLDLFNGQIVRGIAGRREEYRPIVSKLSASTNPLDVARAIRDHLNLTLFYLADLDAISGSPPAVTVYELLQQDGFRLWVDAGLRNVKNAQILQAANVESIIVGLETISGPEALQQLCQDIGPKRLIFSLDLKQGSPLTVCPQWQKRDPLAIVQEIIALGINRFIVLDLACVGMAGGTGTETLSEDLRSQYPYLELIVGGGVRDVLDLHRLQQEGMDGVLIASAFHDGRITATDLRSL